MTPGATQGLTVHRAGLLQCHSCGGLSRALPDLAPELESDVDLRCPRCDGALRPRRGRRGLQTTWALLVASAILYVPANLLPVMSVYFLGGAERSTIIGGAVHLLEAGQWPLALIIFVASVMVPLLKLFALTFILVTIHLRSVWRTRERAWLYRATELVGRWSMVDVFVIGILAGLVQFGGMARIEANAGTFFFAAVVVLTMLSARTLDEHLLWEPHDAPREENSA